MSAHGRSKALTPERGQREGCPLTAMLEQGRRAALCTLALLSLMGCATAPKDLDSATSLISGRLSVQVAATESQPSRGFTGQFELRGDARRGSLELSGPMGATAVRAHWADGRFALDDGRSTRQFNSLDELASQGLGEALPLAALFDWLRGKPWPGAEARPRSDGLSGFEQAGWLIDTADRANGFLRAVRQAIPALTLRVRLDNPAAS